MTLELAQVPLVKPEVHTRVGPASAPTEALIAALCAVTAGRACFTGRARARRTICWRLCSGRPEGAGPRPREARSPVAAGMPAPPPQGLVRACPAVSTPRAATAARHNGSRAPPSPVGGSWLQAGTIAILAILAMLALK